MRKPTTCNRLCARHSTIASTTGIVCTANGVKNEWPLVSEKVHRNTSEIPPPELPELSVESPALHENLAVVNTVQKLANLKTAGTLPLSLYNRCGNDFFLIFCGLAGDEWQYLLWVVRYLKNAGWLQLNKQFWVVGILLLGRLQTSMYYAKLEQTGVSLHFAPNLVSTIRLYTGTM